jgi:nicotinamide-nucleotide amidase
MKAALLTIGTEVTDGEIVNTNASWLATSLGDQGVKVTHHLSTPDDPKLMIEALQWLEPYVDWIFVTGGIGPTSDDMTREVVAKWLETSLQFSEQEWARLNALYEQKGFKILEAHKHQCYFPQGSTPLENSVGSARGFKAEKKNSSDSSATQIAVLPGPPRELKAVFEQELLSEFSEISIGHVDLRVWTLLGITESEAAELVEDFFEGHNVLLGYRASIPFVHVKVWFPADESADSLVTQFEKQIESYIVAKNGVDPIEAFADEFSKFGGVTVYDDVTQFVLAGRLSEITKLGGRVKVICGAISSESSDAVPGDLILGLHDQGEKVFAHATFKNQHYSEELTVPYKLAKGSLRSRKYYTEKAIQAWARHLRAISSTSVN